MISKEGKKGNGRRGLGVDPMQKKKEEKWEAQTWKRIQIIQHKLDPLLKQ